MSQTFTAQSAATNAGQSQGKASDPSPQVESQPERPAEPHDFASLAKVAGDAAHDLNNLLGVVITNLDLLGEQLDSTSIGHEFASEALDAALRGADRARELLAVARSQESGSQPKRQAPRASSSKQAAGRGGDVVILVVEDNGELRKAVVEQLRQLGYRVIEAADGPAALMILNSQPINLLFTDVVMPGGMSGFDLARLVLARWPGMKALITSGFPELEPSVDSLTAGKLRRLIKPYRKQDLAVALRAVLDE